MYPTCIHAANSRWSDKEDLQSELSIMASIEPHPNIINFLGMCAETGKLKKLRGNISRRKYLLLSLLCLLNFPPSCMTTFQTMSLYIY